MSDYSISIEGKDGETVHLDAQVSMMHPEQCTFTASLPLYPGSSAYFGSRERSMGSALVDGLFELEFVGDVLIAENTMTITAQGPTPWEDLIPRIGAAVQQALLSGRPLVSEEVSRSQLPADELRSRVQRVLDEMINPAVASHGGFVNLIDVVNNTVFLQFGGGCQGCGMINVTLKYGVERAIREQIPEVGEILDSTDHASGRNPYYAPSSK